MNESQHPAATPDTTALKSAPRTDYAAWVDSDGCEHLITRDMVDTLITELVSGPDYSLQGRSDFSARGRTAVRYSQFRPHWGE